MTFVVIGSVLTNPSLTHTVPLRVDDVAVCF